MDHHDLKAQIKQLVQSCKPVSIALEGNIGAGKSTVIQQLHDCITVYPEPIDQWQPHLQQLSRPAPPSLLCLSLFVCRGRRYALQE